jgi:hypothetical protein
LLRRQNAMAAPFTTARPPKAGRPKSFGIELLQEGIDSCLTALICTPASGAGVEVRYYELEANHAVTAEHSAGSRHHGRNKPGGAGRGLGLSQHNISFPWRERQGLHQRVRRSKGAGRRLPYQPSSHRRHKGQPRIGGRPVALFGCLPPSWAYYDRYRNAAPEESVYSERTSIFFKHTHVFRIVDKKRNTLVYVALSDKIVQGSPQNSISTVPITPWNIETGQHKGTP